MGNNEFGCIRELADDKAWTECPLPRPPLQILSQLDDAYAKTLAGNVYSTVAWVRRYFNETF